MSMIIHLISKVKIQSSYFIMQFGYLSYNIGFYARDIHTSERRDSNDKFY